MNFLYKNRLALVFGVLFLMLGMLSGYVSQSAESDWYLNLVKSKFNPPSFVFGPTWALLYIMIGIAFANVLKYKPIDKTLVILFLFQFAINLLWSPAFFYLQKVDLALFLIIILWLLILAFILLSIKKPSVSIFFIPYFLWVSFAAFLNFKIYVLNM